MENPKRRDRLRDLDIDGYIILKRILRTLGVALDSNGSG
jgi:hypothetical protein